MKKILSILAAIFSVGVTASSALAGQPNVVNGNPCYKGICIGDNLQSLAALNWIAVPVNSQANKTIVQQNKLKGKSGLLMLGDPRATQSALLHIVAGNIEKKSINAVSLVKFCTVPKALSGLVKVNNDTLSVEVKFVSTNDGKEQGYFVSEIAASLPAKWSNVTNNQVNNLYADLNQKYPGLLRNSFTEMSFKKGLRIEYPPTVEVRPLTFGDRMTLIMGASIKDILKTQEDLRKNPDCDTFYQDERIRIKVD